MRYAGWKKKKDNDQQEKWLHRDSDTTVEVYRYGVKSYIEVNLGTQRIEMEQTEMSFSSHSEARNLAFPLLDAIQACYQTAERLSEEGLGQLVFPIEVVRERSWILSAEPENLPPSSDISYEEYVTNLLNHYTTNHWWDGFMLYDSEPYTPEKERLEEQRAKVKQRLRESMGGFGEEVRQRDY